MVGLLQGSGCSPADFGCKGRGPSVLPDRLPEAGAHPSLRQDAAPTKGAKLGLRASNQPDAAARPTCPHLPLPGNPGAAPPSPRARSPGPGPHTAMAQPETGPSTSSGRIQARAGLWAGRESRGFRLPASGLEYIEFKHSLRSVW
ncbi:small integral membrane protein 15 isoform X1 [Phocoena sinus]|uniref:small integral membrane protein 15 isoform X1 n=1 Tax=Phocoena sinus TaxID=42100 RepID=UPI0013C3F344|nr:small integral membrane protein 15 isoform X1 [Phocoena sinus]